MRNVPQRLEVLVAPPEPLHQKHSSPNSMCDQNQHVRELVLVKLSKERLIKASNSVVYICCTFTMGDPKEEVAIVGSLCPDFLHLLGRALEISEILFPHSCFFLHLVLNAFKVLDPLYYIMTCLASTQIRRGVEEYASGINTVLFSKLFEKLSENKTCSACLLMTLGC